MSTEFAVLYRFRISSQDEERFITAWARLTELIRDHRGGLGSRLHRAGDGLLYAYAQWPSREAWEAEAELPPEAEQLAATMNEVNQEQFEPITLEVLDDLLVTG